MKSQKKILTGIIEEMTRMGDDDIKARHPILELLRKLNENFGDGDLLTGVVSFLQDVAQEALKVQQLILKEAPDIDKLGHIAKFGDLKDGAKFIAFPTDGDNQGHGGYLGPYRVFIKLAKVLQNGENAVSEQYGILSSMPEKMWVIELR